MFSEEKKKCFKNANHYGKDCMKLLNDSQEGQNTTEMKK